MFDLEQMHKVTQSMYLSTEWTKISNSWNDLESQ